MPNEKLLSCPLLPCPFCGSEPELIDGPAGYFVLCNNTECDAGQVSKNWTKIAAITQWNTRTPSPELVELRRDKERLDWLESSQRNDMRVYPTKAGCCWWFGGQYEYHNMVNTLRTAIDAAKEKK